MPQLFFPAPEQKTALIKWVSAQLPHAGLILPDMCQPIGIVDATGRRLLAVAVYHEYRSAYGQIELTAAAKAHPARWCHPDIIRGLLHYPFVQLGVRKLVCHIAVDNDRAQAFAKHAGLTREGVLRHHFADKAHAAVWSMMAKEYRKSRWAWPTEQKDAA